MEPLGRPDVVKLPLPPGVKAGTVVGRGGHNVRWLHFHSGGAHISVNGAGVTIRAKEMHVRERALVLVRRQLEAAEKLGANQDESPLPLRADYVLLESAYGADPRVCFSLRRGEVSCAVGAKDKLYELVPEPRGCGGGSCLAPENFSEGPLCCGGGEGAKGLKRDQDAERDQDPHPLGGWGRHSVGGASDDGAAEGATRFHAATASWGADAVGLGTESGSWRCGGASPLLASVGRALATAAHKVACCEPSFDVLKIRFKLGKSLFRNLGPRAGRTGLSVADLEGAGAGRGAYQSVFSNHVPASAVPRVVSWLTEALGFSLVDTKTSASLHVINQELNVHYSIALTMERGDDSTASLRKLKAGGCKGHSVTLLAAPHQMDLRLKLIAQFREHPGLAYDTDAYSTARRVAAAVRIEGYEGFTRSKRGLPRNRHLEYARRKTKRVYEGSFPPLHQGGCSQRLRVSVTEVQDDKGTHFEVSGCLPEVDAALRHTLLAAQQRPTPAAAEAEPACFVPEWRRGRSSSGVSGGALAPDSPGSAARDWRRGRGSGGGAGPGADRRVYDSASSTPLRGATPSPPSSPTTCHVAAANSRQEFNSLLAAAAVSGTVDFVNQLNGFLGNLHPATAGCVATAP